MAVVSTRDALAQWFTSHPGRLVLEEELACFDALLPNLFGYHLVQIGELAGVDLLSASRVLNRHIVSISESCPATGSLCAESHLLPFRSDSVDVVLLPHVLEFDAKAHDTLREAQRVLVAEGHLVISGFNPWSFIGLWGSVLRSRGAMPWCGYYLSMNRIKDWLALLGFDVCEIRYVFYRPPLQGEVMTRRLQFFETVGRRISGTFAGAYVVVAKKRVTTLTPIRPKWSTRPRLVSVGIVEPSARVARQQKASQ